MGGDTFRPFGDTIAVLGGEGRPAGLVDCFADEVIIDFPSVAPAVERMRLAFVDETPRPMLCARISLLARQAAEGVTLPLDVPVRITCRACGGRGETWSERCAPCDASGTELIRHQVQVTIPPNTLHGTRFRFSVATRNEPPTRFELQVAVLADERRAL